jgi:hypothetical protein
LLHGCFTGRLYLVPYPANAATELPMFGKARVADKRRFKVQKIEFLPSHTVPLDAWYFSELGWRIVDAPKPNIFARFLLSLVDAVAEMGQPGWLRIGATLISGIRPLRSGLRIGFSR